MREGLLANKLQFGGSSSCISISYVSVELFIATFFL